MEDSYLNKYYGLDPKTLETLLSNEDMFEIQPISIYTTHINPPSISKPNPTKSGGVRTFFVKKPKTSSSSALKPPGVIKVSSQKAN